MGCYLLHPVSNWYRWIFTIDKILYSEVLMKMYPWRRTPLNISNNVWKKSIICHVRRLQLSKVFSKQEKVCGGKTRSITKICHMASLGACKWKYGCWCGNTIFDMKITYVDVTLPMDDNMAHLLDCMSVDVTWEVNQSECDIWKGMLLWKVGGSTRTWQMALIMWHEANMVLSLHYRCSDMTGWLKNDLESWFHNNVVQLEATVW